MADEEWRLPAAETRAPAVASIRMVPEEEATGKVKEIYDDIKTSYGIDFVPHLYKGDGREAGVPGGQLKQNQGRDGRGRETRSTHQ